jgi:hypothetical protein
LFKTRKDILCGGFSSISWKNSGEYFVDKKCFIFSLKLLKIYPRKNDINNLYFNPYHAAWFGNSGSLGICNKNKLRAFCNDEPF